MADIDRDNAADVRHRFYGRRFGRKLRDAQRQTLEQGLDRFGIGTESTPLALRQLFSHAPQRIFLEIGFGGGEALAHLAETFTEDSFIGAEPFVNGVASLCRHIAEKNLANIRIWPEDVRLLLPSIDDGYFDGVYILFPDPWPKTRHARRRILQPAFVDALARLIRENGFLLVASDHSCAKSWILRALLNHPNFFWQARSANDWRTPPPNIITGRYATKAESQGRRSAWFVFKRR